MSPSLRLLATGESIPLLCVEGVPGLPGAPQDEAGLTRNFETGDLSLPLGLALGSPIFPSGCEGTLGVARDFPGGPVVKTLPSRAGGPDAEKD